MSKMMMFNLTALVLSVVRMLGATDPNSFYIMVDTPEHSIWLTTSLNIDTEYLADPFIFVIDGEKKGFTHKEFKEKLGFLEQKTSWLGHPVIGIYDDYYISTPLLPGYEIGFRSDGVVVWRAKENQNE